MSRGSKVKSVQRKISRAGRMDHPDQPHQLAQRPPQQVKAVIAQRDAGFPIDRTGRLDELLFAAEPIPEPGFHSVKSGPSTPFAFGRRGRKISHAVGANAGDQMMAVGEQSAGECPCPSPAPGKPSPRQQPARPPPISARTWRRSTACSGCPPRGSRSGWDPVTGWGSPNAQALIPLLIRSQT